MYFAEGIRYTVTSSIIQDELYTKIIPPKVEKRDTDIAILERERGYDYYECGPYWSRNRHIAYPTEYLKYYKLPLGTITFISNTTVDTTSTHTDRTYYTTPLENSTLDIEDYNLDPSKYNCFIDSTIIVSVSALPKFSQYSPRSLA